MNQLAQISVIDPLDAAITRVKLILFRPFNLEKWFLIGFCAWLALLGQGGGPSAGFRWNVHSAEQVKHEIARYLPIIIVAGAILLTVGVAVKIVFLWLSSRGRFTLYILFQIVISLAVGMILAVIVLATCCCAGCIMTIPFIGTVFLLPLLVFGRSYSLLYLAQYGPAYNAIAAPPAPAQPQPYTPPPVQGL